MAERFPHPRRKGVLVDVDPDLWYDPVETKGWLDHEVDCICDDTSEYLCTQRLFEPECMCECHGGWE